MTSGTAGPRDYLLPDDDEAGAGALAAIRSRRHCANDVPVQLHGRFYDSFDWALYQAGAALEERGAASGQAPRELHWLDLRPDDGTGASGHMATSGPMQMMQEAPGFVQDLPPGPVRDRLAPLLGIRRLLPLVDVSAEVETLRLLNDDDKTVARIQVLQQRFRDPDSGLEGVLGARLRLLPVRGYGQEFVAAAGLIEDELRLSPVDRPLVLEALAAAGRRPGAYSSKLDYRLDPEQRADVAAKMIHRGLLDTLEANVPGTKANLDSEFLHDLRVATRRVRSALGQIKGVFPDEIVEEFKSRFAWLQQVTGPVRDLDVYLLDFPELQNRLPVPMRADLESLKTFLLSHYDEEQRRLVAALDSPAFKNLVRDWRVFLDEPLAVERAAPDAARPIKAVADARIWRMFKRVRDEGRAITDESPAEDLHELRKSCKKLRYLLEFFQSLYPKPEMRDLIKQLKVLLDNLGDFQDLAVQAQHLEETAVQMHREGAASVDTLLSMGALVSTMLTGQARARTEFARIFRGFDDPTNQSRFETLFGGGRKARRNKARQARNETSAA